MELTPAEQDALVRYRPGQDAGHVESLFIKLNLPDRRALWLKLTFLQQDFGRRRKVVEGWAIGFNLAEGAGGHVAVKQTWPVEEARLQHDCLYVQVGDVTWRHGGTTGALVDEERGHRVAWDLTYPTEHEGFRHLPRAWMYSGGVPKTKACSPQVDTRLSGWVEIDGRRVEVHDAPGMLGHNWGRQQGEFWTWAHCNAWDVEGVVFEAVTSKVKLGPFTSPLVTVAHLRYPGERLTLNGMWKMLRLHSAVDGLTWTVAGRRGDRRFEARFSAPPEDFVGVDYHDPDGRIAHCLNTKIADAELTVFEKTDGGWTELVTARSEGAAALEIGDREGTRGVTIHIR